MMRGSATSCTLAPRELAQSILPTTTSPLRNQRESAGTKIPSSVDAGPSSPNSPSPPPWNTGREPLETRLPTNGAREGEAAPPLSLALVLPCESVVLVAASICSGSSSAVAGEGISVLSECVVSSPGGGCSPFEVLLLLLLLCTALAHVTNGDTDPARQALVSFSVKWYRER